MIRTHPFTIWRSATLTLVLFAISACGTVPQRPARLEHSSYGCMKAVLREKLPPDLSEREAHCVASGLIARYCSVTEAYLAGAGKELRDMMGPGDAEWRDWVSDRAGIACARRTGGDDALIACCKR